MMGKLQNIITPLHKKTERDYLHRMLDDKVHCMRVAKQYGADYWDGDRRYGYGGYRYIEDRWKPVAGKLIETYNLTDNAKVLDVGCGKAYLLYEIKKLLPRIEIAGFDISEHGIADAKEEIRDRLFEHRAEDEYPYKDKMFDLVVCINTLHNLPVSKLTAALAEIERVGKNKYICIESFRNEEELFNLQCWALTCETFFRTQDWEWLFHEFGYRGDYEFIYFE
jgi:SAM-dependent methyltransferase